MLIAQGIAGGGFSLWQITESRDRLRSQRLRRIMVYFRRNKRQALILPPLKTRHLIKIDCLQRLESPRSKLGTCALKQASLHSLPTFDPHS